MKTKNNIGLFKKWFNYFENKNKTQKEELLKSEFSVTEREGKLWLLHQGVAFMSLNEKSNAKEIADTLNKVRQTAINYKNYGRTTI